MARPEDTAALSEVAISTVRVRRRSALAFATRNPLLLVGAVMVMIMVFTGVFAPWLAPHPADAGSVTHPFQVLKPPSHLHPLGTDQLGRDVLSRVIFGARVSPLIALIVVIAACLVGIPLGLIAGYFGGALDEVLMRVTDIFLAVPPLLLALALATVLPASILSTILAITIAWWPWYARLVRGEAASVASRPYIDNCRVLGIANWRILFRHVLPNAFTPVLVQASMDFGGVILTAAALSFLGLGVQDPTPDWGLQVAQGAAYFTTQWWLVTFPGLAIVFAAMAFNLLGDGLRDYLDPHRISFR